jgi:hypothetical protein
MIRFRRYAWRALPPLLLLALYWPGLTNWFYQDDFGWLNIRRDVHSIADLGPALFAPRAHGNMRWLSENAYFLGFSWLFGVKALPFRIWAFATQIANLLLLGSVVRRLTSSRAAGFWAQVLWIANCSVADIMSWTCIYNQVLSSFFFLLAFYLLLRHIESGDRKFYVAQWIAFVVGLGALDTNVMYPALAAAYALLFARPFLRKILPMFLVSALSALVHFHFAPVSHDGPYALHFDTRIFSTFWSYWALALGPPRLAVVRPVPGWLAPVVIAILTIAIVSLLAWKTRRGDYLGLFAAAWFAIVLAPYVPLSDHIMGYYLAAPAIGLAILGAWAIACAWRAAPAWRICSTLCAGLYLGVSLPAAWAITNWHHDRGVRVEDLVLGVAEIHHAQPGKFILLDGVDTDLFWSGIADVPFRVMEIPHVYLVPGSEVRIQAPPDLVAKFVLPQALALRALQENRAVVYRVESSLRNITSRYRLDAERKWRPQMPRFINLGDSAFDEYLGSGWSKSADGYRWMNRKGVVHIGGPRNGAERLYVGVFRVTSFPLDARLNGIEVPLQLMQRDFDLSQFSAGLPRAVAGEKEIELSLSADTSEPLKFGFVEIR